MDRDNDTERNSGHDIGESNPATPLTQPSSKRIGDTQPFRATPTYRPLSNEPPADDTDFQQTAPYRPVQRVKPPQSPPPRKGIGLATVLGILALLLVLAAVIGYFLIVRSGTGAGGSSLPAESVLPANTLGYLSISPAPAQSQREAFGQLLSTFEAQPGSQEAIASLIVEARRIISGTGISLGSATDPATLETVSGYLGGNVTIALLAPSEGDLLSLKVPAGGQVNQLAAFDVLSRKVVGLVDLDFNPGGPQEGIIAQLRAVKDNLDKAKVVENYNGTDIREYTGEPLPIYFSLLNGTSTAAVGISSAPVKVLIDELRANKGLKEDAGFKTLSGQVPAERVAALYLNLDSLDSTLKSLLPEATGKVQLHGATLITLSGQRGGAQIDIATQGDISTSQGPAFTLYGWGVKITELNVNPRAHPNSMTLNDIPADAMAFLAGSDLKTTITPILDTLEAPANLSTGTWQNAVRYLTSLDPNNDILAWMGGDYTVSVIPSDSTPMISPLVLQMKLTDADRPRAADAFSRGIKKLSNGKLQPFQAAGGTFYPTETGDTANTIIGVNKDRAILITDKNIDAAKKKAESIESHLGKGFGATDDWRTASVHLPSNSNLLGYLDVTAVRGIIERTTTDEETKADYNKMYEPFLKPVKYLLVGSSTDPASTGNNSLNLTRIFVGISK